MTEAGSTTTKTDVTGKNINIERKATDTATGETGKMKVDVKKGAIKDLQIEWTYRQEPTTKGINYITEYTIKDKKNEKLMKELNLTPEQASLITEGTHTITSTSPYTADDIRGDLLAVVLKDLKTVIEKKNR